MQKMILNTGTQDLIVCTSISNEIIDSFKKNIEKLFF